MKLFHRIKFWLAKRKGDVGKPEDLGVWQDKILMQKKIEQGAKIKPESMNLGQFVKERKKILELLIEEEEDPNKRAEIDLEYQLLERQEKTWQKTKT